MVVYVGPSGLLMVLSFRALNQSVASAVLGWIDCFSLQASSQRLRETSKLPVGQS